MNHCELCKHSGNCDKEWRYSNLTYPCEKYEHEQTNEEHMKTLSTEMFAVAIYNAIIQGAMRINCDITLENRSGTELKEGIYEWLQEVYKDG